MTDNGFIRRVHEIPLELPYIAISTSNQWNFDQQQATTMPERGTKLALLQSDDGDRFANLSRRYWESDMMRVFVVFVIGIMLVGCNKSGTTPAMPQSSGDEKVKVVAPGVDVEVQPKGELNSTSKVKVNVPGVNVNVEKK